jgi:hypothetical protein
MHLKHHLKSDKEEVSRFRTKMKAYLNQIAKQLARNWVMIVHHIEKPVELRNKRE